MVFNSTKSLLRMDVEPTSEKIYADHSKKDDQVAQKSARAPILNASRGAHGITGKCLNFSLISFGIMPAGMKTFSLLTSVDCGCGIVQLLWLDLRQICDQRQYRCRR